MGWLIVSDVLEAMHLAARTTHIYPQPYPRVTVDTNEVVEIVPLSS
jgi:hypothetical protein